ncbi:MAG: (E)-4-hydroxy-3-methylbut-2-enyl-diphosphate synthase [Bacteroidetes bacterium]|nr:(E)-4-hydroxy-3-methylbut-2-enyl-diphosphate synthase [Bacteroidota bacterium]
MQGYCQSQTQYKRLLTREVRIGNLIMGNGHPIRVQTMTTTDTMDTMATVEQAIRCIEAGAELIRITAPSIKEANQLQVIKDQLRERGYDTPLVADIHFTPHAAEIAASIVEKVRINPGNYVDKKKFEQLEYTDAEYEEELDRIREQFTPLVKICLEHGTAMRIGTNHGSLSDRILSRYGDTPIGMVESAMEFLRIARSENFHNIVLSMKSSNPKVMVQAYRLLIRTMYDQFGEIYPLHLGVTEAGDGEDGRIKSAVGIGTLLEDGIGDTIRVSLTEDPELEIPVCQDMIRRYGDNFSSNAIPPIDTLPYNPFIYNRRKSFPVDIIGGAQVPVVIADLSTIEEITPAHLQAVGYTYNEQTDKWSIADIAADFIFTGTQLLNFELPGTLRALVYPATWKAANSASYVPLFEFKQFVETELRSKTLNFVMMDCYSDEERKMLPLYLNVISRDNTAVLCLSSLNKNALQSVRRMISELHMHQVNNPLILICDSPGQSLDQHLIHFAIETGGLLLDGMGDGICLGYKLEANVELFPVAESTDLPEENIYKFTNNTAFNILQATGTRISKTEYISCPSCGRTLFDLQEVTARIRAATNHLKGVKIAIMGCIVNGPGEMADADFGYVGSGPGKITLYKGREIVIRNVDSAVAVDQLIELLKKSGVWIEKS